MKTLVIEMIATETSLVKAHEITVNSLDSYLEELNKTGAIYTRIATFPNPEIDGQTVIIAVAV